MVYQRGDIVVVPFPFSDGSNAKKRPALVISNADVNKSGDYILVQITSKEKNDDLSIAIKSTDFIDTPLPLNSFVRCHKIFVLNHSFILYKVCSVKESFLKTLIKKINTLIQ